MLVIHHERGSISANCIASACEINNQQNFIPSLVTNRHY